MNKAEPYYSGAAASGLEMIEHPGWLRGLISVVIGIVIAFFLTWFMSALIATGEKRLDESDRVHLLDFVRVQRNENVQTKERQIKRPENTPPPDAPQAPSESSDSSAGNLAVNALPTGVDNNLSMRGTGIGLGSQDGEYLPIVKIAAVYPMAARQRGIEGNCLVTYTVTTKGSVRDASVVAGQCDHPSFEKVSIEAALKFKYKPRVVNGEAIEVPGVYNRFIFEMQKNEND